MKPTMKLLVCCVLLPFATIVAPAPIRGQRENVLSFLNDALATTEKTIPANITAYRNPPNNPVKDQDSEDMSDAKSTESVGTNGFTDPDSHEDLIPKVVEKDQAPPRRKTGADKDNTGLVDMSSRLVQDQGSREHGGPLRASRERIDLNSEEGMTVDAEHFPGKQVIRLSRDSASLRTSLQREATAGRVNRLNGMLTPGQSREALDWDSLEVNNGRPAPVGNKGHTDYDETREFISSETYPIAPPEHMPRSLSVPAKSRAS